MNFYETAVFTSQITGLIADDSYSDLQAALIVNPKAGDPRGLRKIRWRIPGKGKSGGIRVIYYLIQDEEIYFLYAYPKSDRENITKEQASTLRRLVDEHLENNE